jgi:hypothetical protein
MKENVLWKVNEHSCLTLGAGQTQKQVCWLQIGDTVI